MLPVAQTRLKSLCRLLTKILASSGFNAVPAQLTDRWEPGGDKL